MRKLFRNYICLALLFLIFSPSGLAQTPAENPDSTPETNNGPPRSAPGEQAWDDFSLSTLYLKVQLDPGLKISKLKPGDVLAGKLLQNIYSGDREIFSAGSVVQLTVDSRSQQRREPNDHWPWVIKAFTPRHVNVPVFQSARVVLPDERGVSIQVRLISIGKKREVQAHAKKSADPAGAGAPAPASKAKPGPVAVLTGMNPGEDNLKLPEGRPLETVAAGTPAKIILLGDVTASKSQPGDSVQARLIEPVRVGSAVALPEGSLLRGEIVKSQPPRILSRSGSVMLKFTSLSVPGGDPVPIAASIGGAELNERSHTRIDPEGNLSGDRPGKAWMILNIGVASGIAKEADDTAQLLIEALVSTATDASTAGVAKIAATCASGIFMLTRHGRDVALPKYTEMQIIFDRPVSLPAQIVDQIVETRSSRSSSPVAWRNFAPAR